MDNDSGCSFEGVLASVHFYDCPKFDGSVTNTTSCESRIQV
jgi:hypothetical protein